MKSEITFAVFRFIRATPLENAKSAKRVTGSFRVFWSSFKNFVGLLENHVNLWCFNVFITFLSSYFVGVMKKEYLLGFFRNLERTQFGLIRFFLMFLTIEVKYILNSSAISLGL